MLKSRDSKSRGGDTARAIEFDDVPTEVAVVELLPERRLTCTYEL